MNLFSDSFIRALGLTILDSLWQGAIILLLCTLTLWLMRREPAQWRYRVVLLGILALPICAVFTFSGHYQIADTQNLETLSLLSGSDETLSPVVSQVNSSEGFLELWKTWAQNNASWVAIIWGLGLLLFTIRLLGGFYMVRSIRTQASVPIVETWPLKLKELARSLNISVPVGLKESVKVHSPIVLGYLKPVIIFPIGLLEGLPTDQVEAILLHELAHIKRHDYLLNVLVSLLQSVYFYHPAFWWLQNQLDNEREYSCDDLVLNKTNSLSLIKALTAVKEFQLLHYSPSLGFASEKNQLLKRVERIMNKKTNTNWFGGLVSMSALILSFFLMSYQSKPDTNNTDPVDIDSVAFTKAPTKLSNLMQIDSLTLEEAIIQLINQEESNITIELDDDGKLIGIKKNGNKLNEAERKVYEAAHAKLRQYALEEVVYEPSRRELQEELQQLQQRAARFEEFKTVTDLQNVVVDDLKQSQRQQEQQQQALIEELKEAQELGRAHSLVLDKLKKENGEEIAQELMELELRARENAESVETYSVLIDRLRSRQLSPGKFDYPDNEQSQYYAIERLAYQSNTTDKVLMVVNGDIKENWTIADLDKMDANLMIETIEVTRKAFVPDKFERMMANRDVLVEVTTAPGGKDYKRPKIGRVTERLDELEMNEADERFAREMIFALEEDKLVSEGWDRLELTSNSLIIDGKKQPKKVLKKYLKLYEDITGGPLPKGRKIELEE